MIILGIETATPQCSVALLKGEQLFERRQSADRKHTEWLLPFVQECLLEAEIEPKQLDAVAFGDGPGSFMGVRLAATAAQGLAYAADCPVIPVSTLQILAQTAYQQLGLKQVLAGWDARMQEFYWGCYELGQQGLMQPLQQDQLVAPNDFIRPEQASEWPGVGNAWSTYSVEIEFHELFPEASALIDIAIQDYRDGNTKPAVDATPRYLRGI
ncbi:MAG: tRNA (adenosine(37)-N6)-threonylcarbamoyltransferase complex dimerization subunit type 1 TsaB [Gammaproteobacteria bacterium]|nr:tRNA (adenosine(37)-N6)-threonylcarbamoyltransferase complex dimerization subunit type 1 TsaB [Gammaproteobacteria bacterium]MCH9744897.1 tRNA (adenosine(37)-N6)-threonylcarbamoyltransferase complex dimerization subunit type 1 TsaB [Gammaproteobacteria bacterium]